VAAALQDGHLFAAGIDAFASEPPVSSPLLELENTVVTSHLAGATLDNFSAIVAPAVENTKAVLRGDALPQTMSCSTSRSASYVRA
jgi:phosphoglycerate dehydrogenase-like enzyme